VPHIYITADNPDTMRHPAEAGYKRIFRPDGRKRTHHPVGDALKTANIAPNQWSLVGGLEPTLNIKGQCAFFLHFL
jgi:hypothetical protein